MYRINDVARTLHVSTEGSTDTQNGSGGEWEGFSKTPMGLQGTKGSEQGDDIQQGSHLATLASEGQIRQQTMSRKATRALSRA